MKAYILQLGTLHLDANVFTTFAVRATNSNNHPAASWVAAPVWGVLIDIGERRIIFDLGCLPDAMEDGWPKGLQENLPITRTPAEYVEKQLALIGYTPKDVDTVILSHLHCDHFGAIELFGHCDVYVPKEEWVNALIKNHENNIPGAGGSYIKRCVEFPVKQYHPVKIGDDFELLPGLHILTLPGHTDNLLGIMLHLENSGTLIFPSDACSLKSNYTAPGRPGLAANGGAYLESVEKLHRLEARYNATILFSHDMEMYQGLKKAPEFYD